MSHGPVYVQSLDIETTGARLQNKDILFAIGSAVLAVSPDSNNHPEVVESRRWVLNLRRGANQTWADVWAERGWEQACFDQFWSKHTAVLDSLMKDTPRVDVFDSEGAMAASFNAYLADTEKRFRPSGLTRVYDTVGFDVTNLDVLLERNGHRAVFLWREPDDWPCNVSYLGDVRNHALGVSPLTGPNQAQKEARRREDAAAVPANVVHNHDPAQDALCIGYKWTHYAKKAAGTLVA